MLGNVQQSPPKVDFIDAPLPAQPPANDEAAKQAKLAAEEAMRAKQEERKNQQPAQPPPVPDNPSPVAPTSPSPEQVTPSTGPVQPGVTTPPPPAEERDPLLDANGPNTDALPMPSTAGQEVGKPWTEERPNGITVEYRIPEGNGSNTVDAIVRDADNNVISTARIVAIEGTGKYVRWQDDVGAGASYYESGASGELGYGQHFAPGASTSGIPTSVFEASPDLTKVRTISYDQFGNPIGIDVGSRNEFGLYDNTHSDMYGNETFTATRFNSGGGLDSKFTGQVDAAGNGWMLDAKDDRWDIYSDEFGRPVQRRINPATNGYEFKYTENGIQVHELRDKSGRLLELSKTGPDGRPTRQLRRVGDLLATGIPGADGKMKFTFTDNTSVGTSFFTLPWEDRPRSRTGELTFTPDGGMKFSYTDGGWAEFGADGKSTAFRPADDTRALWKKAVSFAGNYYYGMGTSALGAVEGITALAGINDQINLGAKVIGSSFELTSRQDALTGIAGGFGELFGTAFNAYKTLGVEAYGLGAGEQSWGEAWRNVRRPVGANWNATSKLVIGTDWQGASGNLAETMGHAAFGAAMFFVPVKGPGAAGKGGRPHFGGSMGGGPGLSATSPLIGSAATRYVGSGSKSPRALIDGFTSKLVKYGREKAAQLDHWSDQPVKSFELVSNIVAEFWNGPPPAAASAGGRHHVPRSEFGGVAGASDSPVGPFMAFAKRGFGRQSTSQSGRGSTPRHNSRVPSTVPNSSRKLGPYGTAVDPKVLQIPLTKGKTPGGQTFLVDENGVPHVLADKPDNPNTRIGLDILNNELKSRGLHLDHGNNGGVKYYIQDDSAAMASKGNVNGTVAGGTADLVRVTWRDGGVVSIKSVDVTGTDRGGVSAREIDEHASTIFNKLPGGKKFQTQNVLFFAGSREQALILSEIFKSRYEVRIIHSESGFDSRPNGWP
ncbi:hypothetical protein ACWF82_12630 [Nocardia sp. NPDC055053]